MNREQRPELPSAITIGSSRASLRYIQALLLGALSSAIASGSEPVRGPLSPGQSLDAFQIDPGLRIEIVAAEPLVIDPVAIAFDERGRMYVAEDRGYPTGPGKGKPPEGRIALIEDTNGDGRYDKRGDFATGLTFPNGVMCWQGGVFVTCAPDLFYFKDTDGDGKADVKKVVFTGFQNLSTTQLRVSHPTLGLDNWVYLTSGLTSAKVTSPEFPDRPPVALNRTDFRFRPETDQYEPTGGTAQFGQTFDRFGRRFICSNRNHVQHVVMQTRYLRRNPHLAFTDLVEDIPDHGAACRLYPISANITTAASHTGFFTAACGVWIYEGAALPEEYRGNSFTCDPAGNLVHRDILKPAGATFVASRARDGVEFLASRDDWFRPVNLTSGPDGALYVIDMYRKTIEHPDYLPEATRKVTDFESGKDRGRIYRIVAGENRALKKIKRPDLTKAEARELCATLNDPDVWWRMTAHRLLLERSDPKSIAPLRSLAAKAKSPETRVHALHLLEASGALTEPQLERALTDAHPAVREHALQLAETRAGDSPALVRRVIALADDSDANVRFQCALTIGELQHPEAVNALANIARRDCEDRWTRAAVLSAVSNRARPFLDAIIPAATRSIAKGSDSKTAAGLSSLLRDLGRALSAGADLPEIPPLLQTATTPAEAKNYEWQLALLAGVADGLKAQRDSTDDSSSLMSLAAADSSGTPARIRALIDYARNTAARADAPLSRRLMAVELLSHAESSLAAPALLALMQPNEPAELQAAAVRALSQTGSESFSTELVKRERWLSYTPAVRDAVLSTLLARADSITVLLNAVESGDVPAWTVNADRRNQLMKHKNEAIREKATELFKEIKAGDRMKIYEDYKSVLSLKANAQDGRAVFEKHCASCHVFAGDGHSVGPDLTGIRNQPPEVLLLHIIVPEHEIMPIYTAYTVETKDGQSHSGLLASETPAAVTLKQALGLEQTIARANLASMTAGQLSLMPQELEKAMTRQDLADLIAFLRGE